MNKNKTASGNWRLPEKSLLDEGFSQPHYNIIPIVSEAYFEIEVNNLSKVEAAEYYYDLGFNVIPLEKGGKRPIGKWHILKTTRLSKQAATLKSYGNNIGVLTGRTSQNLFVIDCDSREGFYQQVKRLNSYGLANWLVETPRGGHIWLLSKDGEVREWKAGAIVS